MEETMTKVLWLLLLPILFSCVGQNMDSVIKAIDPKEIDFSFFSLGEAEFLVDDNGSVERMNLSDTHGKPTIMLFSSLGCGTCEKEHVEIARRLKGNKPEAVNLYSFLVDMDINNPKNYEALKRWRLKNKVSWPFGGDNGQRLSKNLCREIKFPCVVIFNEQGEFVASEINKIHPSDFKTYIGFEIGEEPDPISEFGSRPHFGRYFEEKMQVWKGEGEFINKEQIDYTKELDRPFMIVFSKDSLTDGIDCQHCQTLQKSLTVNYNSANPALKRAQVLNVVLGDEKISEQQIVKNWQNKYKIPWGISVVQKDRIESLMEKYCQPTESREIKYPCVTIFSPMKGITMQRDDVTAKTIQAQLTKEHIPSFFEGNFKVLDGIVNTLDEVSITEIDMTKDLERPLVFHIAGTFCDYCIQEHNEIVSRLEDPNSIFHTVNMFTILKGYDMNDTDGVSRLASEWKIGLGVPWAMSGSSLNHLEFQSYVQKFCQDSRPFESELTAPCTAIFLPKYGKVFESYHIKVDDIERILRGEEVAPYSVYEE